MAAPTYFDWLTLFAVLVGPLVGIWVTRLIDRSKEAGDRRWAVFEGLIKTRGLELSPDHVSNLNLVPLLFSKDGAVTAAHSRLMQALNDTALGSENAEIGNPAFQRVNTARQDLVVAIGRSVGAALPDGTLERLGYAPQAWATDYNEGQRLRKDLIDVINGRKAMHMVAGVWELNSAPVQAPPALEQSTAGEDASAQKTKGSGDA